MNVLILGGGFGGVKAALELSNNKKFEVTLLSDQPDFRFYPALYETATGRRDAGSSIPLSEIFSGSNVRIKLGKAATLDRAARKVSTQDGQFLAYDALIIALGSVTNFFGIKGLEQFAYGIKSLSEADRLRKHIHQQLIDDQKPDANYVIIGGGPTGIELAGALPHYIHQIMDKHNLPPADVHIDLVEAADRLVPRMSPGYSNAIAKHLQKLGVNLYLGQKVEAETADGLMISGHSIASHTVIWTAGVASNPFLKDNNFKLDEHGKAAVDEYLQAEPSIYVIGDNAGTQYSGMAQTALYDAIFVCSNLKRAARGKQPKAYEPKSPAYITPAGPGWAAVQWRGIHAYGRAGWLLRNAADLVAYHDLEPWWRAGKHWLAAHQSDDACQVCGS